VPNRPVSHVPAPGRPVPSSTYRLQLTPDFGFDDVADLAPYLADLGVSHVYCSPWLQAAPGSRHGYDVVDHSRVNDELGGQQAFERMTAACRAAGLGIVLDVVPNHMSTVPEDKDTAWWSVLREGPMSAYAPWFDVDWSEGQVLVPVLGAPLADSLDDIVLGSDRVTYFEHVLPLAPGSLVEGDVPATLAGQHWRLAHWRTGSEQLSHRRFFDVTTLAGLRVEDPDVFAATHALVLQQLADGAVEGLRIDHPDGLADPEGYLTRLAEATGGAWVVVEKILEAGEQLPASWPCAGTTGYDALNAVQGLFVDPAGEQPLTDLWRSLTGDHADYDAAVSAAKHQVLEQVLAPEVDRLVEAAVRALSGAGQDVTRRGLREALVEVLAAFDVYRAYVPPRGVADELARARVGAAVEQATAALPRRAHEVSLIGQLALADGIVDHEFVTRFQQTCGPVMAKGVEDTTFYRWLRLSALNEVGGDPSRFGLSVSDFHDQCATWQRDWPVSMTGLSTHDTKRSEDVRARLVLLSQDPAAWGEAVVRWGAMVRGRPDPATEQLVWQSLVGAWPISADRAVAYLEKATREAKVNTSWTDPVREYDERVAAFVRGVLDHPELVTDLEAFVERLTPAWRSTVLAQKLVQLTMPGVADTYQGCELVDLSLVDPDNRRPVDFDRRRHLLAEPGSGLDADKLRVTSTALRLRRRHPEWFGPAATYDPVEAGAGAVAFVRSGRVLTVARTRAVHPVDAEVDLPDGTWVDALTGATAVSRTSLADLLTELPVALLVRS